MPLVDVHSQRSLVEVPACQVEIPPTSRERYITGVYALNITPPENTTGDWHDAFHWREGVDAPDEVLLGGSAEVNTNHIYGDFGVYEGRERLVSRGLYVAPEIAEVYLANHFRAILDMLYQSLSRFGNIYGLDTCTVSWLDTPEQQRFLLDAASKMVPHLPAEQQEVLSRWIMQEAARE